MKTEAVIHYINNLDIEALKQLAFQLIVYPDSFPLLKKAIEEFNKFYMLPIESKEV